MEVVSRTTRAPRSTPGPREDGAPRVAPSGTWQGWAFAGAGVMCLMGLSWALLGLVTLLDEQLVLLRERPLPVDTSPTTWGWVHLVGGVASFLVGAGILWGGHRWARTAGIVVAVASAVVNLGFLAATPVWATLLVVLDVLVVYALTVHGREIDEAPPHGRVTRPGPDGARGGAAARPPTRRSRSPRPPRAP
ncbi:DUF7144 family membrane protein [Geodermatophilus sp. SYSU D00708]